MIPKICKTCGITFDARTNSRDVKYCSQKCFGIDKRKFIPKEEKIRRKAEYDREYRSKNLERIKERKRDYNKKTYDPIKAAKQRKKRSKLHVEYCRKYYSDPKRKEEKRIYDQIFRNRKRFGEHYEAAIALTELQKTLRILQPDKYERLKARGYYDRQREKIRQKRIERNKFERGALANLT